MLNPDFNALLSIFNDRKVKYLVVGGYAVGFHAQPRATKDLDLFIRPDLDNAESVYAALQEFGAPLTGVKPKDICEKGKFFRIGSAPVMIEIFPEMPGVEFDDAWERRVETTVDAESGLTAFFISREDLIAAKLASARPQDLADVDALNKSGKKHIARE